MLSQENLIKELIDEYYKLALLDISNGASIYEMEKTMELYKESEMYEACAGILKAINQSKFLTLKEIKLILKDGNKSN